MALVLVTLGGPRSELGEILGALRAAGMPASVSGTRFHALEERDSERITDDEEDAGEEPLLALLDQAGEPVWVDGPADALVEALTEDLGYCQEVASRYRFTLRMHEPAGLTTEEADAIALGLHQPNPAAELVENLRRAADDPQLRAVLVDILGGAQ